ncbi:MAG: aspartyl-phosphate phosphatase Spo0E family protein [Clostridia bacterium]|nr:aspartyl-phosphate phosphatase Spo0E family protein [Clostridia bacterium]MBQ9792125.1 aspartyl-phosphate phosphatase Spo0E family protein [Clostridia bacterium]
MITFENSTIEQCRAELDRLISTQGTTTAEVLRISQELDKHIVEAMKQQKKK